jgi:hypothetical protein
LFLDFFVPRNIGGMMVTNEDFMAVQHVLESAGEHHLEIEVVAFALEYALTHPGATIGDCMEAGLQEWVK